MPELPEVETIVNTLKNGNGDKPSILAMEIEDTRLLWERSLAEPNPQEYKSCIPGQKIEDIDRRGKFIRFSLSNNFLLIHLRMSGSLDLQEGNKKLSKHTRMIINLKSGWSLVFIDPRKFGRIWLTSDPGKILNKLGPEPLDKSFKTEDFYKKLQGHHRQIKPLITDQKFLAGLGNIYSDEALHNAGIHPLTPSDALSQKQSGNLLQSIREVLTEGIRLNGTSIDWVYQGGDFQDQLRVYRRTGEPCPVCDEPIQRIVVGQRGTHFCPQCQPVI